MDKNIKIDKTNGLEELTVTIVGLGVIGGSFAESLTNIGFKTIYGIDINEDSLVKAKEKG